MAATTLAGASVLVAGAGLAGLSAARDLMALGIWLASFGGKGVVWRNTRFRLSADGRLQPAARGK